MTTSVRKRDLALIFLRLGATAFGGPATHIAMMEELVVRKYQWLSHEEFLDLLGATNLIPGPNSTEMAIHIGHKTQGWKGLLIAGTCFILPAFLIVWLLAWFYVRFGELPALQSAFEFIKPVILAVIAQAIWNLSRTAVKDNILSVFAVVALLLYLMGFNEILILLFVAIMNLVWRTQVQPSAKVFPFLLFPYRAYAQEAFPTAENLFWYFAKVGSVLFGSGYVLIAFLQNALVDRYHWITQQQLVDAIAVGQFTPGPVFTTATFVGYLVAGHSGAMMATVGIFAPAFVFVALSAPLIPRLRRSPWTSKILDGLNVASLSLMTGAALMLAKSSMASVYAIAVFVISLFLLIRKKWNSVWLILAAALLGVIIQQVTGFHP